MEELSLFDLDDDARPAGDDAETEDGQRSRRGRRRGRRRGGRRPSGEPTPSVPPAPSAESDDDDDGEEDLDALLGDADVDPSVTLAPLGDVPDEEVAEAAPAYDDDEEEEEENGEGSLEREREQRRRARLAKLTPEPEPVREAQRPRRRSAIVVHADRDSILAGLLLARDIRLLEGFWVYPQEDLMTFFRGVATDLRSDTPIYVVGFAARPARDSIQAAALYAGRISWFDHHDWPPEDLEALRSSIGPENVQVEPGGGSSVPAVLADRTRRSRFSDKLVDLAVSRFTRHDYERWGRVWWHRLGEIASQRGDRRSIVEPLLAGRPSELARKAAREDAPPLPPELEYAASRDFRVVHFGGYALVIVPVPEGLDLHLTARIARERLAAQLSVATREGAELLVLGCEDARGRRELDLDAMARHLAAKHEWIELLRAEDHVARVRVRGLVSDPARLDDVVAEVAMGRSILEG